MYAQPLAAAVLATVLIFDLCDGCLGGGEGPSVRRAGRAMDDQQMNVFGKPLKLCSLDPLTGWFRDGYAKTRADDTGVHVVCAQMTDEFLEFTKGMGNDLSTPRGGFPGLKAGDQWALCALRWRQAYKAGYAPKVVLEATNEKALEFNSMESLQEMAVVSSSANP